MWCNGRDRGTTKTGLFSPLTVLPIQTKKGAAVSPLNCRFEIPSNRSNMENTQFQAYFSSAWTLFPHRRKTPSSVCQKDRFTGLFGMRSCLHLHHTCRRSPYAEPDQMGNHSRPFPNIRSSSAVFRFLLACGWNQS